MDSGFRRNEGKSDTGFGYSGFKIPAFAGMTKGA